jgi:hypothetical protein
MDINPNFINTQTSEEIELLAADIYRSLYDAGLQAACYQAGLQDDFLLEFGQIFAREHLIRCPRTFTENEVVWLVLNAGAKAGHGIGDFVQAVQNAISTFNGRGEPC